MIKIDWKTCGSMAELHEQERLEFWIKNHREFIGRELNIFEVGAYQGQSTALLAQFGYVITCDTFGNVDDGIRHYDQIGKNHYDTFIENMKRLSLIDRVFPITSTSMFLDIVPCNMGFDVVYIDGSHHYEDVKLDIEASKMHVNKGGLLIADDYKRWGWKYPYPDGSSPEHDSDPWGGVGRAFDELIAEGDFEIVEHYYGKLCLRRK